MCSEVGVRIGTELQVLQMRSDHVRIVSHRLLSPRDLVVASLSAGFEGIET